MQNVYLIQKNMGTKMFSNFSWHMLRIWLFCPKIEKDLGKFSFVASLICFVSLQSTMLQTSVPMHKQIYTKNNSQFLTICAQNLTILPKNSESFDIFSFVAKFICFVGLWSVRMQTFVPMHQQMYILKVFSYFSRFLHRIRLFCPKIAKSWCI